MQECFPDFGGCLLSVYYSFVTFLKNIGLPASLISRRNFQYFVYSNIGIIIRGDRGGRIRCSKDMAVYVILSSRFHFGKWEFVPEFCRGGHVLRKRQ